jgi:hypothetical protein
MTTTGFATNALAPKMICFNIEMSTTLIRENREPLLVRLKVVLHGGELLVDAFPGSQSRYWTASS